MNISSIVLVIYVFQLRMYIIRINYTLIYSFNLCTISLMQLKNIYSVVHIFLLLIGYLSIFLTFLNFLLLLYIRHHLLLPRDKFGSLEKYLYCFCFFDLNLFRNAGHFLFHSNNTLQFQFDLQVTEISKRNG